VVSFDEVRSLALSLPRTEEHLIRGRLKYRIKQIVYLAASPDETEIGFGFPREERAAIVEARPDVFFLPRPSDLRFQWICARLDALEPDEAHELVLDAWRMCVPKRVAAAYLASLPSSSIGL
jgi:hypothetical protein